jgi:hypothetical protein
MAETEAQRLARKLEMKAHGGPNPGCTCLDCQIVAFLRALPDG